MREKADFVNLLSCNSDGVAFTPTESKQIYRALLRELHPDKNPDPSAASEIQNLNAAADDVFNRLRAAPILNQEYSTPSTPFSKSSSEQKSDPNKSTPENSNKAYQTYRRRVERGCREGLYDLFIDEFIELKMHKSLDDLISKVRVNQNYPFLQRLVEENKLGFAFIEKIKENLSTLYFEIIKAFTYYAGFRGQKELAEHLELIQPIFMTLFIYRPQIEQHEDIQNFFELLGKHDPNLLFELSIASLHQGKSIQDVKKLWQKAIAFKHVLAKKCCERFADSCSRGTDALRQILELAIAEKNAVAIQLLLEYGAPLSLKSCDTLDKSQRQAISERLKISKPAQIQLIKSIASAADITLATKWLEGLSYDLQQSNNALLALYFAIQQGYSGAASEFIKQGARLTEGSKECHETALSALFAQRKENLRKALFIDNKDLLNYLTVPDRQQLLSAAVQIGDLGLVEAVLLAFPLSITANDNRSILLKLALDNKRLAVADYLLSKDTVWTNQSLALNQAQNLLTQATKANCPHLCRFLIAQGAGIDALDQYGLAALHYAIQDKLDDVFTVLIELGAVTLNAKQTYLNYLAGPLNEKLRLKLKTLLQAALDRSTLAQRALLKTITNNRELELAKELLIGQEWHPDKANAKNLILFTAVQQRHKELARTLIARGGVSISSPVEGSASVLTLLFDSTSKEIRHDLFGPGDYLIEKVTVDDRKALLIQSVIANDEVLVKNILRKFPYDAYTKTEDGQSLLDLANASQASLLVPIFEKLIAPSSPANDLANNSQQLTSQQNNTDKQHVEINLDLAFICSADYSVKKTNLDNVKTLFTPKQTVEQRQQVFGLLQGKTAYFNQHRNPKWDRFWGKQHTKGWQKTWKDIRQEALAALMTEVNASETYAQKIEHLEWARTQSLFNEHRHNWGWGRTSAVKAIDAKIAEEQKRQQPPNRSWCCFG